MAQPTASREALLRMLTDLLQKKGPSAVAQVQQKISLGQPLVVKGCTWDVDMLKEVLARSGMGPTCPDRNAVPRRPASPCAAAREEAAKSGVAANAASASKGSSSGVEPPKGAKVSSAPSTSKGASSGGATTSKGASSGGATAASAAKPVSAAVATPRASVAPVGAGPSLQASASKGANPGLALPKAATAGAAVKAVNAAVLPPKPAGTGATVAPAAAPAAASSRWSVSAPSASSLTRQAQLENDKAESFVRKVKNVGENKVAVLAKPNVTSQPTGEYVLPGETVDVIARCMRSQDCRTFLRLRSAVGWVCTRSRKDFWKIVIADPSGANVEPAGIPTTLASGSLAAKVLPHVTEEGKPVGEQRAAAEPRSFRVVGRFAPLLNSPSLDATMPGAALSVHEAFEASGVCLSAAEGRAYLRLADGRGWVCERVRGDFQRLALEPVGFVEQQPLEPRREQEAKAEIAAEVAAAVTKPKRGPPLREEAVVFRSDDSLWPTALGKPRPIKAELRVALRRLANHYGRKVQECEEDLKEVEARAAGYTRACDGKKQLQTHAEAIRKEQSKIEGQWKVAVEKAIAGVDLDPAPELEARSASGSVLPVQVLGNTWHCAIVQSEGDGRRLGPLRSDANKAAEDLRALTEALAAALEAKRQNADGGEGEGEGEEEDEGEDEGEGEGEDEGEDDGQDEGKDEDEPPAKKARTSRRAAEGA